VAWYPASTVDTASFALLNPSLHAFIHLWRIHRNHPPGSRVYYTQL
jgi:hypothetical protein